MLHTSLDCPWTSLYPGATGRPTHWSDEVSWLSKQMRDLQKPTALISKHITIQSPWCHLSTDYWYCQKRHFTVVTSQRTGVTSTLLVLIRRVLGSNLGKNIGYADKGFWYLPSALPDNCHIILRLGNECFLPNPCSYFHTRCCGDWDIMSIIYRIYTTGSV
jgi:hypothetical protein